MFQRTTIESPTCVSQFRPVKPKRKVDGFTLLELLVVVAILAAVAMIATSSFVGGGRSVETDAKIKIAKAEMAAIAKAVKQFKADTGYYPKEGVFAHEKMGGNTIGSSKNLYNIEVLKSHLLSAGAYSSFMYSYIENAFFKDEFYAPYNLDQLFFQPTNSSSSDGEDLLPWSHNSGYGWNGPYLNRKPLYVGVRSSDTNRFCRAIENTDGVLDILFQDYIDGRISTCVNYDERDPISTAYSSNVPSEKYPSLPDPFSRTQGGNRKPWFSWTTIKNPNPSDSANKAMFLDQIGSPYMVFGLNQSISSDSDKALLRVVSLGLDGEYAGLSNAAPTSKENCTPNTANESDSVKVGYKREIILCF